LDTGQLLPIDKCRFHNWKHPNDEIAIIIDDPAQLPPIATSMSKTPQLKRQDLTAVRLAHPVQGCQPLAIPEKGAMLQEGDRVFQATAKQDGMLSQWSGQEPVSQIGTIRYVLPAGPQGIAFTQQGRRPPTIWSVQHSKSGCGRELCIERHKSRARTATDLWAVETGRISVTPIKVDLTAGILRRDSTEARERKREGRGTKPVPN
jgi:hypothetical protein